MADEYISKQSFNDAIREAVRRYPNTFYNGLEVARQIAHDMDAADVAPVRHGRWRLYSPLTDTYECDKCGYQVIDESFRTNYCHNCGAKMDGEE